MSSKFLHKILGKRATFPIYLRTNLLGQNTFGSRPASNWTGFKNVSNVESEKNSKQNVKSSSSSSNIVHHHETKKVKNLMDMSSLYYTDLLPWNISGQVATHEFLQRLSSLLYVYIDETNDRKEKVLNFHHPAQLQKLIDLELPDEPRNLDQVLLDCVDTLKYEVKTGHPHFFNQLSQGLDTVSMAGEWLTATANTNMFTYEIAPVFILMEDFVLRKMRKLIGWDNGDSILTPGGTIANLCSLLCARHKKFPQYKKDGLKALPNQLVIFASDLAHYSIKSAAMVSGIGTSNFVPVPADTRGHMIPSELERLVQDALSKGQTPFYACATAGTTVFGAFDPLPEVADICQKYGLWLHVDAAWGGSALLSRKHRYPGLNGIERADSVTWNPHKLMSTILQCSTLHVKEAGILMSCNEMDADYLFPQDKFYDSQFDTGDKVIQCGRHNDIFKLWLQWRAKGTIGLERHVDHQIAMSDYLVAKLKTEPHKFHLIIENPEFINVCFWYIPKRLRSMPHGPEKMRLLGQVCHLMKQKMMEKGTLMVACQPQKELPIFFRNVMSNPGVRVTDVDFLVDEMDRIGQDL